MGAIRLDVALVERGIIESRELARRLILAGEVSKNGQRCDKASTKVFPEDELTVREKPKYVSRGGLKLEGALDQFGVNPEGKVCLDIGASTGGFTDCLLQRGALRVHALDVGTNQLVWKLRNDPRVKSREQFNVRYLKPEDLNEEVELIVADVSFISLTLLLGPATACLKSGGELVVLIKPQFELEKESVGQGGIVRDEATRWRAVEKIRAFATNELGLSWLGEMTSPITGTDGNVEFLAWMRKDCL